MATRATPYLTWPSSPASANGVLLFEVTWVMPSAYLNLYTLGNSPYRVKMGPRRASLLGLFTIIVGSVNARKYAYIIIIPQIRLCINFVPYRSTDFEKSVRFWPGVGETTLHLIQLYLDFPCHIWSKLIMKGVAFWNQFICLLYITHYQVFVCFTLVWGFDCSHLVYLAAERLMSPG